MNRSHRREFLADVGRGMLLASVGQAVAHDLGLAGTALADDSSSRLTFGPLEPLVALMQDTPVDRLLPAVVERIHGGEPFGRLVTAAALANARTFGGQDYEGYHTIMALVPAFEMSHELPAAHQALPLLKVFYRNTNHIQNLGGHSHEALHPITPTELSSGQCGGEALRDATRRRDYEGAERMLAGLTEKSLADAYNDLQYLVQDNVNVHRVVLAWRAWSLLDLAGKENATTLLRQSVRFCCDEERHVKNDPLRDLLPRLLETKGLQTERKHSDSSYREATDQWIEQLSHTIYASNRQQAAEAVTLRWPKGFRQRRWARRWHWPRISSCCTTPAARRKSPASRRAAFMAPRSGCTPPMPPTPGATSPGSATTATGSPA